MKKILFALLVLLIAAPAWARVDIWCEQVGDTNEVVVYFDATSEANLVRAIAADIQCDGDGKILGALCANSDFYVSPGKARGNVNTVTGSIDYDDPNTACVCEGPGAPPGTHPDTKPGLPPPDSNGITIEMATLYDSGSPSMSGELVRLRVDGSLFNIVISENVVRGGVVMEDPDEVVDVNATGCTIELGCFPSGHDDYTEWLAVGEPDCWCYPRQCHGDADGIKNGNDLFGWYYVGPDDLNIFISAWKVLESPHGPGIASVTNGICADFDHTKNGNDLFGWYRVGPDDLNIFTTNWKVLESPHGAGVPGDCLD